MARPFISGPLLRDGPRPESAGFSTPGNLSGGVIEGLNCEDDLPNSKGSSDAQQSESLGRSRIRGVRKYWLCLIDRRNGASWKRYKRAKSGPKQRWILPVFEVLI